MHSKKYKKSRKNMKTRRGGALRMLDRKRLLSLNEQESFNEKETKVMNPKSTIGKLYAMYNGKEDPYSNTTCAFLEFLDKLQPIMDPTLFRKFELQLNNVFKPVSNYEDFYTNIYELGHILDNWLSELHKKDIEIYKNYQSKGEEPPADSDYKLYGEFRNKDNIGFIFYDYVVNLLNQKY